MKPNAFIFLTVGLLVGSGGTAVAMKRIDAAASARVATAPAGTDMSGMHMSSPAPSGSAMSMADMTASLSGKTGDDFDKAFLSEMIVHHQGAIAMAELAAAKAKHQEVKDLANGIVSAQTGEISEMRQWQEAWGYQPAQ